MENAQNESVDQVEVEDDLDQQIMDAMSAQEAEETPEVEAPEPEESTEEAAEEDEVIEASDEAEAEEEAEEEESLEPQHHWRNEYKESFKGMNRGQQESWLAREKEYEQGMQAKSAELNQVRGSLNDVQEAVGPYVQGWQMKGITPFAGLNRALLLANELDTNPQEALIKIAQERGVNLESAIQEAPYVDPQFAQVQRELNELKEQHQNAQQSRVHAEENALKAQLTDFRDERDADGNLTHPHFEQLFVPIANYLKAGQAQTLAEAYEIAVRYDPNVQAEAQGQKKVSQITRKQEAVKKAKKASKAVDSVEDSTANAPVSVDKLILDQLEAAGVQ